MKNNAHYQSLEYERVRRVVRDFAKDRPTPVRVLDFGCGHGKYLSCFSSLGCHTTGVDSNAAYVAEASRQGHIAVSPEAFFSAAPLLYDVIFMSHLIEHLAPTDLTTLIPRLCDMLATGGRLIIVTPTVGERFYHDFTHVRPYLPQSIRHAFGQIGSPISFGETDLIELVDIYFFKDPYRTRSWRSFYVGKGPKRALTRVLNASFDAIWRVTGGRCGVISSWLGVYRLKA
jgi:SAM-dependent methyltransferase